jgi:hypothetical protein
VRLALLALLLAACSDDTGTLPSIAVTVALADGRTCRDAGATAIELPHVQGDAGPIAFVCFDAEAPRSVVLDDLPLDDVELVAISATGAPLYRGDLHASQFVSEQTPAATVVLYADVAR